MPGPAPVRRSRRSVGAGPEMGLTTADQPGVTGQADGWVAVAYQGTEQLLSSWVAGRFQNAVIRAPAAPADDSR